MSQAITIEIPGASPPIPALSISLFEPGGYRRSAVGWARAAGRSLSGTPLINGPSYQPYYTWAIAAHLSESDALQLEALAAWQDAEYKAGNDGALKLTDSIEYLPAEASPHSKTLVAALNPSWNAGYEYGYGVFSVKLNLPEEHRSRLGVFVSGDPAKLIAFTAVEV